MALGFAIAKAASKKDKHSYHADKIVSFTDKLRRYFTAFESQFSSGCTLLLTIDEYADTILYDNKIKELLQLCVEIQESRNDYNIFSKCKPFDLTKEDLQTFSTEFAELLQFALDNDKTVLAIGD